MNRGSGRDDDERNREPPGQESEAEPAGADVSARRKAAAYLRAAKLTDDGREREALRQKAAELLSPRRNTSSTSGPKVARKL